MDPTFSFTENWQHKCFLDLGRVRASKNMYVYCTQCTIDTNYFNSNPQYWKNTAFFEKLLAVYNGVRSTKPKIK